MRMPSETEVRARLENSRKELLDLSLRNPLLNYRPLSARGVEIVGENSHRIFETIVTERKTMTFLPAGQDEEDGALNLPWDESEAAIWMRKGNFDSLDTSVTGAGLRNTAQLTVDIWAEYERDPERVLAEALRAYLNLERQTDT